MTTESGNGPVGVHAHRNRRPLALSVTGVVLLFGCWAGVAAADGWFETWNDGNAVNPTLDWEHTPMFSGSYDASSGDYVLAGQDLQETITGGLIGDDDEILNAVAAGGDDAVAFDSFVSVRTRAHMDGPGGVGVSPFGDLSVPSGYGAVVHYDGYVEISVFTADPANPGIVKLKEAEYETAFTDVFVQLDSWATEDSNATMSLTFWLPGEPQPAEPQLVVDISNDDDEDGFPLAWVLEAVPPTGPAGVLFNEDEGENEGDPEGTGTFFWAMAQTDKLINGDINRDGEVNGLDVDPFVAALLGGTYDPLADMNSDDEVNGLDVDPFVDSILGGGAQAAGSVASVPEPTTLVLACVGVLACIALRQRLF